MRCLNTQYSILTPVKGICIKVLLTLSLMATTSIRAQTLPVGTPILEDYYRRMQLLGKIDSNISFTVRPLTSEALKTQDVFNPDTIDSGAVRQSHIRTFARGKGKFQLLPITLQTQYNSKRPYGWNDGPMIPARGFQSLVSAGIYARYGPLNMQLRPEIVYAENRNFPLSATDLTDIYIDLPQRFGERSYKKIFAGQSSVRLTFGHVSFGLSSENLWWGPGIHNSLLMSNSASGFNHLTLNTVKPVNTFIGSFEAQIIGGRLEGSTTDRTDDWRYLSSLNVSYQLRWVPGLFLGLTRSFQMYHKDIRGLSDYMPLFQAFEKKRTNEDAVPRDQLTSVFTRWLWKEAKAEVYFEFGREDHSANVRDFLLQPEHSRAFTFGFEKIFGLKNDDNLQLRFEGTNLQQSISSTIRTAGSWYKHAGGVYHGYTNRGEILGAGIGPGSNYHVLEISWTRGLESIGLQVARNFYKNDYYPANLAYIPEEHVDITFGFLASKQMRNLLVKSKFFMVARNNNRAAGGNLHTSISVHYNFN